MKLSLILLLAAFTSGAVAGTADTAAAKKKELAQVKARIAAVKQSLDAAVGRQDKLTTALRKTERALGEASAAVRQVEQKLAATQDRLDKLKADQARQQQALDGEKAALAAQIRAAYMAGREGRIKLILNQQDPARFQRMLTYYDYFNRARSARIDAFNAALERLAALKRRIDAELAQLTDLKDERAADAAALERRRAEREAVLAKVNASIDAGHGKLKKLEHSRKALERLIASLTNALADIPGDLDSVSFPALRGKLAWPVAGPHLASYGSLRADGRLHWNGVLIGGKAGEPVHAIAHGRVVYAGWLPRFGLLMIIDHGGGYLSLYAHNQSLYKEVGDWVKAGAVIAALGDSGGQGRAALYFEIRHDKKPVNPGRWCKR